MNRVRQICATSLLTMALTASTVLAGDMPCGVTDPPPPPPENSITGEMPFGVASSASSTETSATGNMPMGIAASIDPLTELTLGLLQGVFSLF